MAQTKELYDPIRRASFQRLPEEEVRQSLIQLLINELGYPKSLISVEVALSTLPHLYNHQGELPLRRADLLIYKKEDRGLKPFVLVECKADRLNEKAKRQIIGYNAYVQAPFLILAAKDQVLFGYRGEKGMQFQEGLPRYKDLLALFAS